jgi:hypothetical protein
MSGSILGFSLPEFLDRPDADPALRVELSLPPERRGDHTNVSASRFASSPGTA